MSNRSFLFSRRGFLLSGTILLVAVVFFYLFRLSLPYRSVLPFRVENSKRVFSEQGVSLSPMAFVVGDEIWPGDEVRVYSDPLELMGANRNELLQIIGLQIPWTEMTVGKRLALKNTLLPRVLRFRTIELIEGRLQMFPQVEGLLDLRAERQPSGALTIAGDFRLPDSRFDFSARVGWDSLEEFITLEGSVADHAFSQGIFSTPHTFVPPRPFWSLLPRLHMRAQALLDDSLSVRSRVVLAESRQADIHFAGAIARVLVLSLGLTEQKNGTANLHFEAAMDRVSLGDFSLWKVWLIGRQKSTGPVLVDVGWEASAVSETFSRLRLEIEEDEGQGKAFFLRPVVAGKTVETAALQGFLSWDANGRAIISDLSIQASEQRVEIADMSVEITHRGVKIHGAGLRVNEATANFQSLLLDADGIYLHDANAEAGWVAIDSPRVGNWLSQWVQVVINNVVN